MLNDIKEVLIPREKIAEMCADLGRQLSRDYEGKNPLLVCILKGSVIAFADIYREMTIHWQMVFMCASSYGVGSETTGVVRIVKDLDTDIEGRDVIIVEDIIDSGVTLSHLMRILRERKPASLEICTLLSKPERRRIDVPIKYKGMDIPDEFVVGYGLDYAEKYRNLKDVCILKPEVYQK